MKKEKTKPTKPVKPGKTPGAFKKPIKKKTFVSRYEKLIEHPQDRQFFKSCFVEKDEMFHIREGLTKDDVKRLKGLLKIIKANRKGAVKFAPLIIISAIVAAIVIFFAVFANPLLGRAMEKGLEAVFEAKAEVRGFRLSLINFEIRINKITVANKNAPMTNLFDMGRTVISLKPQAVLRGKVYIEEISAAEIRFGTPRTKSGALPARPQKVKEEKPKSDAPPLVDLKNFDAMALFNQEYDKLNTPKLYDEAINTYNETSEKYQKQVEDSKKRIEELQTTTAPLLALDINNMRDIEIIRSTIQDINIAVTTVQAASNDVSTIVTGLERDINTARAMEANARNAITDDINYLKSFIDLGSGNAFATLEPFIREMLSDTAEEYLDYGIIALEVLEKLKAMADAQPKNEKPKKVKKVPFKGRTVTYPTARYPTFYLGRLSSDFTLPETTWNWSFDLRNVSSNPDFIYHNPSSAVANGPVLLNLGMTEDGGRLQRKVAFSGGADFRSNADELFNAELTGNNFPLSVGDILGNIGINGFSGETDFALNMSQTKGAISGGGNVFISQARVIDPKGTIAEAVGIAVEEAGVVDLGIQYTDSSLNITTNLADLIAQAVRRIAEVYAKRAMDEMEAVFRQKIDEYIGDRFESKEQVDALLNIAKGDKAVIDQTISALNAKANELQQNITGAARQVVDDATRQAEEAAQKAREDAERQAQLLKEEAERKAKEEAEKAARDAVQGNLPSLPSLPGRR